MSGRGWHRYGGGIYELLCVSADDMYKPALKKAVRTRTIRLIYVIMGLDGRVFGWEDGYCVNSGRPIIYGDPLSMEGSAVARRRGIRVIFDVKMSVL